MPEFDPDELLASLGRSLASAASFHWITAVAQIEAMMTLAKRGMGVQRMSLALFGVREPSAFDCSATPTSGIVVCCGRGATCDVTGDAWRIREQAVGSLVAAYDMSKNVALRRWSPCSPTDAWWRATSACRSL